MYYSFKIEILCHVICVLIALTEAGSLHWQSQDFPDGRVIIIVFCCY